MPTPYDVEEEKDNLRMQSLMFAWSRGRDKKSTWCKNHKVGNLLICCPGLVIPQGSVKKRLNNSFCKKHPQQCECQP